MNTTIQVKAFHTHTPWSDHFTLDAWTPVEVTETIDYTDKTGYYVSNILGCSKTYRTPKDAITNMLYENGYTQIQVRG